MARVSGEGPITLSVLDRLIDMDPKRSDDPPLSRSQSLREHKANVCRDLEWLFNSRQSLAAAQAGKLLRTSVFVYGLPDISSLTGASIKDRKLLSQALEESIRLFEPRIQNPRVTLASTDVGKVKRLRFIIEGLLRVDPSPEPVSFDTVLDVTSGEYIVPGDAGAR